MGPARAGASAVSAASAVRAPARMAMGPYLSALAGCPVPSSLALRACRNATTVTRLVMVRTLSALPWSQSESARLRPYSNLAAMAAGMERKTKTRQVANPTVTPFGQSFSSTLRKYKKARYGKSEAPKNGPARSSARSGVMSRADERQREAPMGSRAAEVSAAAEAAEATASGGSSDLAVGGGAWTGRVALEGRLATGKGAKAAPGERSARAAGTTSSRVGDALIAV